MQNDDSFEGGVKGWACWAGLACSSKGEGLGAHLASGTAAVGAAIAPLAPPEPADATKGPLGVSSGECRGCWV